MKKLLLILTFFVLTNFVNGQDKMGHGNEPEGADSAGIGTVTTWVKPSDWTYEGMMTVGEIDEGDVFTGYRLSLTNPNFGSLNPTMSFNYDTGIIVFGDQTNSDKGLVIYFIDNDILVFSKDPITIQIDGVDYVINYDEDEGVHWDETVTINPFPPAGQTCEIKLRYTLAP